MNTYFNVLPVGGLGNRLLAVLSATRVARRRGLTPRVFWMPDSECQCAWSDLFGLDIATTDAAPQTLIDRSFAAYEGWRINVPLQTLPRDNDDFSVFSNTVFLDDNEVRHPFRHQGHQLATFADELAALQPLELIENDVRRYVAGRNFADMLGIHIRRGHQDANFDTEWMKSVPIDGYRRMAVTSSLSTAARSGICRPCSARRSWSASSIPSPLCPFWIKPSTSAATIASDEPSGRPSCFQPDRCRGWQGRGRCGSRCFSTRA